MLVKYILRLGGLCLLLFAVPNVAFAVTVHIEEGVVGVGELVGGGQHTSGLMKLLWLVS